MAIKKAVHRYIYIGEDANGRWHTVAVTEDGKKTTIEYDMKSINFAGGKTIENEMLVVFGLIEREFFPMSMHSEAVKKCKEHNDKL